MSTTNPQCETRVREALPLVHHIVNDVAGRVPRHVDRDDLWSAAMLGLTQAAVSYDPDRGVAFIAFARSRINGAVLDELRGRDWLSRRSRARARVVQQAATGGELDPSELAQRTGLDEAELRRVRAEVDRARHLDRAVDLAEAEEVASADAGPEAVLLDQELRQCLRRAVDALPERLRAVVEAYFFEGRQMQAIAADMGVTASRVSQLCSEAMTLLREGMRTQVELDTVSELDTRRVSRRTAAYHAALARRVRPPLAATA